MDAVTQLPELALRAPEAAEAEDRGFHSLRIRALQGAAVHMMLAGGGDRRGAARQGFAGDGHGGLLELEHRHLLARQR
jgi:hypothetical protein